jgi:hypothetical protein
MKKLVHPIVVLALALVAVAGLVPSRVQAVSLIYKLFVRLAGSRCAPHVTTTANVST